MAARRRAHKGGVRLPGAENAGGGRCSAGQATMTVMAPHRRTAMAAFAAAAAVLGHGACRIPSALVPAATDAAPACLANAAFCDADKRTLHTCDAGGNGAVPGADVACAYACAADSCRAPTNVPIALVAACGAGAPPLAPAFSATVLPDAGGAPRLHCSPDCGDGLTTDVTATIVPQADPAGPDLAVFCFSVIDLPGGATLDAAAGVVEAVVLVSASDATIAGAVDFGGAAGAAGAGGAAGPGGGSGASVAGDQGAAGGGQGGGGGGVGDATNNNSSAGGGGGYAGAGGAGGDLMRAGYPFLPGGVGGAPYAGAELTPLRGGSGGGSGGSDDTGGMAERAAGGGGGALQIVARGTLTVSGVVRAAGGDGQNSSGGHSGGGGGSGGGLLLEAPVLLVTGALLVDGGRGGDGTAHLGGVGATGAALDGSPGTGSGTTGDNAGGGGGAGGLIRLHGGDDASPCPPSASPAPSCSASALAPVP